MAACDRCPSVAAMNPDKTVRTWRIGRGALGVVALLLGLVYGSSLVVGLITGTASSALTGRELVCALTFAGTLLGAGVLGILRGFQFSCRACGTPLSEQKAKVGAAHLGDLWASLGAERADPGAAATAFGSTSGANVVTYDYCGKCFAYGRLAAATDRAEVRALDVEGEPCRALAMAVVEARLRAARAR